MRKLWHILQIEVLNAHLYAPSYRNLREKDFGFWRALRYMRVNRNNL